MHAKGKRIGLVTGASSGLGAAFARAVDASVWELDELWLVARRMEPMRKLAAELRRIKGRPIATDLQSKDGPTRLIELAQSENADLRLLVNNAGYGKAGAFSALGLEEQLGMVDLNARALTELTWRALPLMQAGSAIVQVASSIAYVPAPNFAVYAASKAYVLSFSEALEYELRPRGVRVMAVCPGPVRTEFFDVAGKSQANPGRASRQASSFSRAMAEPADVARRALSDLRRGKVVSIYGGSIRAFAAAAPFLPRGLALPAIAKRRWMED